MALHRGIQSAVFYYVSCAPCAEERVRKRRKAEAERDRADREALEAHMPGLYRQPDPSSTNPYWQAEIDAGPIPMRTRKRLAENSKAATNSTRSNIASSVSVDASALSMERSDSAKSGLEPFQRQDEVLWGAHTHGGELLRPPSTRQSSSHGLPKQLPRAKINDEPSLRSYRHMQNAAVNDLHPPTTRKIYSKDEVSWMLQPPPLPEVMSGKDAVFNRSNSNASRPSAASTMSRQPSERVASYISRNDATVGDHVEDTQGMTASTLALPERALGPVHRSRTMPVRHHPKDLKSEAYVMRDTASSSAMEPLVTRSRRTSSRPQPSSLLTDSAAQAVKDGSENDRPHRAASFNTDSRQHAASTQTLDARASVSGTAVLATMPSQYKWLETRVVVPRKDSLDDHGSEANTSPENFDAWQAPEFELPQWIHEHTKREVRQRWSFDM